METTKPVALITGRAGFTGRYLSTELIQAGYQVVGLEQSPQDANDLQADLLDAPRLRAVLAEVRPDFVVHLAAIAFVAHQDANTFYQTNVIGTRNLLEAIAAQGKTPKKVLLASSANIYGNNTPSRLNESTPPAPANDYAVSKLAMEYMARLWMDRLPIIISRPFNYTGVGQSEQFLLPKIVRHFRQRAPMIELGNLDVWRDFSDVRAIVAAYAKLLTLNSSGQTVNVCSGNTFSIREVISMCGKLTGHTINIKVNPKFVRQNEVKELRGDATYLHKIIGNTTAFTLEDTLSWMLQSTPSPTR